MDINSFTLELLLLFIIFLLVKVHNWLIGNHKNLGLSITLTPKKKWSTYLVLFGGTMGLMFFLASSLEHGLKALIVIGVTAIFSFFIISPLNVLLTTMREDKLSWKFLMNQNFLLIAYLVIFTELVFLNWLKEIETYVKSLFLAFIILYSVLLVIVGLFLGIPTGRKILKNWRLIAIIVLDASIVGFLMGFLVKMMWDIILLVK
jgi:glucan phosphoethanolaminetransferase (alkaline phosphatase superfamily)